jgi:ABC-type nitrate/sulfonate/bicarbonate transport system permease component
VRHLRGFLQRWLVFLVAVAAWEAVTRAVRNPYFPPPSRIVRAAATEWFSGPSSRLFLSDTVFHDVFASIARLAIGWLIAMVFGIVFGLLLGRSRTTLDYFGPLLAFARAVPPPALVPVFITLLGIGAPMQVSVIVFGVVWPILLNTVDGAKSVDQTKSDTARSFGIPRGQWLFGVVLPAALPKIFAGLRVSLSLGLVLMVVSELIGGTNGLGYELILSQHQFDFPTMWAGIVLLGVLGYLLNTVLLAAQRRTLRWQPDTEANPAKMGG